MALPLIAAGIAARTIASKLTTRAIGGITGAGAKTVTPVYRNMNTGSVKVLPNSTIGLVIKDGVITKNVKQETIKNINKMKTNVAEKRKSGEQAKSIKDSIEPIYSTYKKSPTVKVNSNPRRGK